MRTLAALVALGALLPAAAPAAAADAAFDLPVLHAWAADDLAEKRRRPRVPGGSGCDDPRDVAENPECRC